jgi:tripartite ATP-independent transporter DctM subunit
MEWYTALLVFFGILVVFMATGMPIAFAFIITCMFGSFWFWGGAIGFNQLAMSFYSSVTTFVLLPLPLFILMGNIIHVSGIGMDIVDSVDKILGRLPGRLSLLAIGSGTLLGTMIGISAGTIAILGRSLVPEMKKRGYKNSMTLGPVVSTGALATLIPPSALAVFMGAIGGVSVSKFLIAIIIPGLILSLLFCLYIIARCMLQSSLAPSYNVTYISHREKFKVALRCIAPVLLILFACIGVIFTGIATPSEAAALGAMACFLLTALYKRFSVEMVRRSLIETIEITVMIFVIIVGSISFSRILASSGAITGLVEMATSLPIPPMAVIIATQVVVIMLGCFLDPGSIIMITVPMFMPIVKALEFNTVWYLTLTIINIQLGLITPPFGLDCYTLKAMLPGVSVSDVFRSVFPFLGMGLFLMVLLIIFPELVLWLPDLMLQ